MFQMKIKLQYSEKIHCGSFIIDVTELKMFIANSKVFIKKKKGLPLLAESITTHTLIMHSELPLCLMGVTQSEGQC